MKAVETIFTLQDGAAVRIRRVGAGDARLLIRIFERSSPQSIYQRFLSVMPRLTFAMARHLAHLDHRRRLALIAEADGAPVGVVRYEPTSDPEEAELGLAIVDDWQNRGLGRILLRQLLRAAEANGIKRLRAHVLGENRRMLRLLATECRIADSTTEAGVTTVVCSWTRPAA